MKDFLDIAGNVHLQYYIEAADKLGIEFEVIVRSLMARFSYQDKHWFIINTALPVNNVPSTTIAKRKSLTYKVLDLAGIPVAKQVELLNETEAIDFFNEYGQIVLKPVQNLGGIGVSLLPRNEQEVIDAFQLAEEKNMSKTKANVLGEEFIEGINYRLLVCDDKVLGVVRRKPASVIGDGASTITQLIDITNIERRENMLKPIKIDNEVLKCLDSKSLSTESIPDDGEEILLRFNSNLSTGGTTEECMGEVDPYYLQLAVEATKAIGLKVGGVDLIAKDITRKDRCVINEINYNPGLRVHYKADKGEVVDVATPIMEYIRDNI